jgi:chromate transporter
MNDLGDDPGSPTALVFYLLVLSLISFGGIPAVLPDLREFVVNNHGWLTDRDFANCFAIVQVLPGPNMILMMAFIGWQVGGVPTAIASSLAIFVPSCLVVYTVFRVSERYRDTSWQRVLRRGLAPVTIGLVVAGGYVMSIAGGAGWASFGVTAATAALLFTRLNPLWLLAGGGALGGFGLL